MTSSHCPHALLGLLKYQFCTWLHTAAHSPARAYYLILLSLRSPISDSAASEGAGWPGLIDLLPAANCSASPRGQAKESWGRGRVARTLCSAPPGTAMSSIPSSTRVSHPRPPQAGSVPRNGPGCAAPVCFRAGTSGALSWRRGQVGSGAPPSFPISPECPAVADGLVPAQASSSSHSPLVTDHFQSPPTPPIPMLTRAWAWRGSVRLLPPPHP